MVIDGHGGLLLDLMVGLLCHLFRALGRRRDTSVTVTPPLC